MAPLRRGRPFILGAVRALASWASESLTDRPLAAWPLAACAGNGAASATVFVVGGVEAAPAPPIAPGAAALRLSNLPDNPGRAISRHIKVNRRLLLSCICAAFEFVCAVVWCDMDSRRIPALLPGFSLACVPLNSCVLLALRQVADSTRCVGGWLRRRKRSGCRGPRASEAASRSSAARPISSSHPWPVRSGCSAEP